MPLSSGQARICQHLQGLALLFHERVERSLTWKIPSPHDAELLETTLAMTINHRLERLKS